MMVKRIGLLTGSMLMVVATSFMFNASGKISLSRATSESDTKVIETVRSKQEKMLSRSKKRSVLRSRSKRLSRVRSAPKRFVIDKILARVSGTNILQSDLEVPRISKEGAFYSLEDLITEELFIQRAVEQHMLPSQLDIERQIVAFKMQNGMADIPEAEFEKQLQLSGFTLKMYKEQLGRLIAVENVKRAEVSEKLVVTAQDVEEYYKKHPSLITEAYHLKVAHFKTADKQEESAWEDVGWIEKDDLDKQFAFVPSMKKGETSQPVKVGDAYQAVQIVDRRMPRQKTLKECYIDIEKKLYQEKKEKYLKNVEKDIRAKASIVYL